MKARLTANTLAQEVEARIGVKPNLVKNVISCLAEIGEGELGAGYDFKIPGIATVRLAYRPKKGKRMGRNPHTGEEKEIGPSPAKIAVAARPDPRMRRAAPGIATKGGKEIARVYKEKRGL